ncbi:MAG: transglutaminase family protein [Candidatus Heimdallarchaeota archaeon]|nr:MAG: transglutaminase family protein [Candidatus Heimdallarchaeota archaeon]
MVSKEYLDPTFFIDSQSEIVTDLAHKLSLEKDRAKIAIATFNYVRDEIKYTIDITRYDGPEDMKASTTLQRGYGFCIPKSIALVALFRANQIPARLHFADIINHRIPAHLLKILKTNVMMFHGYVDVYLNGKWIKLTPSFETPLCERHDFPVCEFDGVKDATFQPHDNNGNRFVEYIKDRGVFGDLPYDEITSTFSKHYGYP